MAYYGWQHQLDNCEYCDVRLTGYQERYCSSACAMAVRRAAQKPQLRVICELCGELFYTHNTRRKRCRLASGVNPDSRFYNKRAAKKDHLADAGPGDPCWDLQNEELDALEDTWESWEDPHCEHCGDSIEYGGKGRRPKFCSTKCRVYAHRAKKSMKTDVS